MNKGVALVLVWACSSAWAQEVDTAFVMNAPGMRSTSCIACVTTTQKNALKLVASSLTDLYQFRKAAQVMLSFRGGVVKLNNKPLIAKCQSLKLRKGDLLSFAAAQGVALEVPQVSACKP